ncbi:MFS general substrate transporter [Aspergillus affinis]|uniref:MFS general substrate transporter n=1 Tax=Aspergillus affinis TaxID=1070780 RepID=UPI0022FF3ACF|nr:MFS general substrate transporter [Aspergillus affinis]KAI9036019.1 MFS general substrate transporter [Aspergillus affinis]
MLEDRLHQAHSRTQFLTSVVLAMNALVSIVIAPFTAWVADHSPKKNIFMVFSWILNGIGTIITAWVNSLTGLFIGRLVQTIAGSLIWNVGMAIIADTVGPNNLAKAMGFSILFITAGLLCGPAVSGSLYQFASYSTTWASTFVVSILGVALQSLIIRPYHHEKHPRSPETSSEEGPGPGISRPGSPYSGHFHDRSPLLPPTSPTIRPAYQSLADQQPRRSAINDSTEHQPATHNVYWMMLRKGRVTMALIADALFAILIASFETTLPIHIKSIFHWESLQAGLLFLLLQVPSFILVVPAGWMKDRIGMRYPVTAGYLLLAPFMWLLGVPGLGGDSWAGNGKTAQIIYIIALVGIGIFRVLPLGLGAVEVFRGANELGSEYPGIFGPYGGYSRSFSLSNITWKLAMFVGPLISAALTQAVGYYYLNLFLGQKLLPTAPVPASYDIAPCDQLPPIRYARELDIGHLFPQDLAQGSPALLKPPALTLKEKVGSFDNVAIVILLASTTYYMPFYFQAGQGVSPIRTGVEQVSLAASLMIGLLAGGAIITATGHYMPVTLDAGASCGLGLSINISHIAVQVVFENANDILFANGIAGFFGQLGVSMGVPIAYTVLLTALHTHVPRNTLEWAWCDTCFPVRVGAGRRGREYLASGDPLCLGAAGAGDALVKRK